MLAGIESATVNLSQAKSADTFEAIAQLLRLGAQKGHLIARSTMSSQQPTRPFTSSQITRSVTTTPTTPPQFSSPASTIIPKPKHLPQSISQPNFSSQSLPSTTSTSQPQPDWLKPKVFKSSGG